ncbi:MAG: type II toxin-antitoxin system HicA family toxin [Candidatus Binataceae bacterium]
MKFRDLIKLLEADGWCLAQTEGSHRQFRHPHKKGKVTVAGHPTREVSKGTLVSIFKQAQMKRSR